MSASRTFEVWAPHADEVTLVLGPDGARELPMEARDDGTYSVTVAAADAPVGTRYRYRLGTGDDARLRADPASRWQPEGVHGPSAVMDETFEWHDDGWVNPPLDEYVILELHVGTFSDAGTFDGAIPHLTALAELGITAVEIMPIAEFPGGRNWGYDGVFPSAAQSTYGGPDGLRRLVDAAHATGLAVILDVVYNHLGPEGNHLADFGPYFTSTYATPWGDALNFDGADSDHVRRYFVDSALSWIGDCHIDALRLDAIHAIVDSSARPFVLQLTEAVHELAERRHRTVHLIAESAANDVRVVTPATELGLGNDAQWADDFHHSLHVALTGERTGYYADFTDSDIGLALLQPFVYDGRRYSPHRRMHFGSSAAELPASRFVVFDQNHDHIGNRPAGDRLISQAGFEAAKLAAATLLASPYVPLLFQGQEYGERAPFPYFISHTDPSLVEAVRQGRAREFTFADVSPPDPQAESTFRSAVLDRHHAETPEGAAMLAWYRRLLQLRRDLPALAAVRDPFASQTSYRVDRVDDAVILERHHAGDRFVALLHFGPVAATLTGLLPEGSWRVLADSASVEFNGPDAARGPSIDGGKQAEIVMAPMSALWLRAA
ncbi:MAG: treZ [Actinomycetia bacterium]|nr:treZ [Actinomycetes bacterium]